MLRHSYKNWIFEIDALLSSDPFDSLYVHTEISVIICSPLIVLFSSFPSVQSLPGAIVKSVRYLEKKLPAATNPYAVAMASYALANEKKLNRTILYKASSGNVTQQYSSTNI